MIRSSGMRGIVSGGAAAALFVFALVGAWHHHGLVRPDHRALDRPEHGVASGPCHVCKLATARATLPTVDDADPAAPPSGEIIVRASPPTPDSGVDASCPARAPPGPANA